MAIREQLLQALRADLQEARLQLEELHLRDPSGLQFLEMQLRAALAKAQALNRLMIRSGTPGRLRSKRTSGTG